MAAISILPAEEYEVVAWADKFEDIVIVEAGEMARSAIEAIPESTMEYF